MKASFYLGNVYFDKLNVTTEFLYSMYDDVLTNLHICNIEYEKEDFANSHKPNFDDSNLYISSFREGVYAVCLIDNKTHYIDLLKIITYSNGHKYVDMKEKINSDISDDFPFPEYETVQKRIDDILDVVVLDSNTVYQYFYQYCF